MIVSKKLHENNRNILILYGVSESTEIRTTSQIASQIAMSTGASPSISLSGKSFSQSQTSWVSVLMGASLPVNQISESFSQLQTSWISVLMSTSSLSAEAVNPSQMTSQVPVLMVCIHCQLHPVDPSLPSQSKTFWIPMLIGASPSVSWKQGILFLSIMNLIQLNMSSDPNCDLIQCLVTRIWRPSLPSQTAAW